MFRSHEMSGTIRILDLYRFTFVFQITFVMVIFPLRTYI